jgi:cytochrome c-type biogenesis protein CcmF
VIGVYLQPMTLWLWVGGLIMAFGTLLAVIPGRRRRPTDPTSTLDAGQDVGTLRPDPPAPGADDHEVPEVLEPVPAR